MSENFWRHGVKASGENEAIVVLFIRFLTHTQFHHCGLVHTLREVRRKVAVKEVDATFRQS